MSSPLLHNSRLGGDEWVWRESQPMCLLFALLLPASVACLALSVLGVGDSPLPMETAGLICAIHLAALLILGRLVTEVHSDRLVWHFGWFGWPRWQLHFDDIVAAELTRNAAREGLGLRFTASGRLYNAHGLSALRLTLKDGRQLRLGTQDGQALLQALRPRVPALRR